MELRNRTLAGDMTTDIAASSWASVDTDSPPPSDSNNTEEEEELVEDYDEDYGDYIDDDYIVVPPSANVGGPSLNFLGPSEVSDIEKEVKDEKKEDNKEVKRGCGYRFLKLCKQAGSSILGFVRGVAIRIKSKISKKQAVALVALCFAAIKATTITSSNATDTPEEIAEAKALEEKNDALINDITSTVVESVVEELVD